MHRHLPRGHALARPHAACAQWLPPSGRARARGRDRVGVRDGHHRPSALPQPAPAREGAVLPARVRRARRPAHGADARGDQGRGADLGNRPAAGEATRTAREEGKSEGMNMKRWIVTAVALAAALIVVGCGGGGGSGNATDDALSFMPKDAPVVITLDTDPNGDQWKQVNKLIGKFPFGGQVKAQLKQSFGQSTNVDYDKEVKPILGNELVFTVPTVQALQANNTPVFGALKVDDEGKANDFVKKDATK